MRSDWEDIPGMPNTSDPDSHDPEIWLAAILLDMPIVNQFSGEQRERLKMWFAGAIEAGYHTGVNVSFDD
jgi:hypothetical protein